MAVLSITVKTTDGSSEWQLIICPRYPLNVQILSRSPKRELDLFALWLDDKV